ncbi:hypothetical protein ACWEQO_34380 [Streptomyces sp. NPDC004051]
MTTHHTPAGAMASAAREPALPVKEKETHKAAPSRRHTNFIEKAGLAAIGGAFAGAFRSVTNWVLRHFPGGPDGE